MSAPEGMIAQIIDGVLDVQPRPACGHALAASELGISIGSRFGRDRCGPGGWVILDKPEVHLDGDVLVPDLTGWRVERMPRVPADPFFTLTPDWACEVLSPSTASVVRLRKMRIYHRAGVRHVWLIDPSARSLEVYRHEPDGWKQAATFEGAVVVHAEPFEAEPLDLRFLWIEQDP